MAECSSLKRAVLSVNTISLQANSGRPEVKQELVLYCFSINVCF